ncbi:MAG: GNAT family N-acetyltransferase [Marinosulfonomonas sp.]
MDEHPLDRPVWTSLTSDHAGFAVMRPGAARFQADISPLAGLRDDSAQSLSDLGEIIAGSGPVIVAQVPDVACPDKAEITLRATALQFVHQGVKAALPDGMEFGPLEDSDAPEMVALAHLTKPGPFEKRTHELGQFWGIKQDGVLLAMAGERMRQPGFAEVSGVCTHPSARGRGYGTALCKHVFNTIIDRGVTPYLHAYEDNDNAIALYEALGFKKRTRLNVVFMDLAS